MIRSTRPEEVGRECEEARLRRSSPRETPAPGGCSCPSPTPRTHAARPRANGQPSAVRAPICQQGRTKGPPRPFRGLADQRPTLLWPDVAGRVVEIGAAMGSTSALSLRALTTPNSVTIVHAFDPDPYLRRRALGHSAPPKKTAGSFVVSVCVGDRRRPPLPDGQCGCRPSVGCPVLSVNDSFRAVPNTTPRCPTLLANSTSIHEPVPRRNRFAEPCSEQPT